MLIAVAVMVVASSALVWWAVSRPTESEMSGAARQMASPGPKPAKGDEKAELVARGLEIERRDKSGQLLWRLKAEGSFTGDKEEGVVRARGVAWELSARDGTTWHASAPEAEVREQEQRIVFSEGVRVWCEDKNLSFEAAEVVYEFETKELAAAGPVKLDVASGSLEAERLVLDTERDIVRAREVRGRYRF